MKTCKRGHRMTRANTIIHAVHGYPECRECKRMWNRRYMKLRAESRDRRRGYKYVPPKERTHCPEGHAYAGDNLRFTPKGWRVCRICKQEERREREGFYDRHPDMGVIDYTPPLKRSDKRWGRAWK